MEGGIVSYRRGDQDEEEVVRRPIEVGDEGGPADETQGIGGLAPRRPPRNPEPEAERHQDRGRALLQGHASPAFGSRPRAVAQGSPRVEYTGRAEDAGGRKNRGGLAIITNVSPARSR